MEDGNVELRVEAVLDLEAGGRGDVLEVDPAVLRSDGLYRRYYAFRVGAPPVGAVLPAARKRDRPRVDVAERLEEDCLALHHRDGRRRAEVAESENRSSIGNDGYEIGLCRRVVHRPGVRRDFLHRVRNAGRVGEAQVVLGLEGLREAHGHLAALVELQHFFSVVS